MDRIERERDFHNALADQGFGERRLIDRLSRSFYSKDEKSPIWGPVWSKVDLREKRVLDYGCGSGDFTCELSRRGAEVYGIDISESLVAYAQSKSVPGILKPQFFVRDAHATGFPDCHFDLVFGNGILHHLELEKAYSEIARILRLGGRAFFMEPLDKHPLLRLVRKATPSARSVDEKPLSIEQIARAERFFSSAKHTEHFIFAVAAAPIHLASDKTAFWLSRQIDRLDQGMIRLFPDLGRYAWLTMLEFEKL